MPDTSASEVIAAEICKYLASRPRAADTLEGIKQWWLPVKTRGVQLSLVQDAVEMLEKAEVLERVNTRSGTTIYRVKGL